ncbi:hypothetical protein M378DRAFT_180766 [Amanita muscaria Koide BX008]|uniref:Uncharacterized protein n=1 Tax=Amanita muscaria (strain Koide BX008) TaxID=946122 RepID=A0A0C2S9Q4_AMAMK|nr:hypothetical protein M378DRAFT_180766 [Amanita muscaria Koide BX008]
MIDYIDSHDYEDELRMDTAPTAATEEPRPTTTEQQQLSTQNMPLPHVQTALFDAPAFNLGHAPGTLPLNNITSPTPLAHDTIPPLFFSSISPITQPVQFSAEPPSISNSQTDAKTDNSQRSQSQAPWPSLEINEIPPEEQVQFIDDLAKETVHILRKSLTDRFRSELVADYVSALTAHMANMNMPIPPTPITAPYPRPEGYAYNPTSKGEWPKEKETRPTRLAQSSSTTYTRVVRNGFVRFVTDSPPSTRPITPVDTNMAVDPKGKQAPIHEPRIPPIQLPARPPLNSSNPPNNTNPSAVAATSTAKPKGSRPLPTAPKGSKQRPPTPVMAFNMARESFPKVSPEKLFELARNLTNNAANTDKPAVTKQSVPPSVWRQNQSDEYKKKYAAQWNTDDTTNQQRSYAQALASGDKNAWQTVKKSEYRPTNKGTHKRQIHIRSSTTRFHNMDHLAGPRLIDAINADLRQHSDDPDNHNWKNWI